jgi:hypothetical protein
MLVSSANKVGFDILVMAAGRSLIYRRKSNGPRTESRGTPCTRSQFEKQVLDFLPFINTL